MALGNRLQVSVLACVGGASLRDPATREVLPGVEIRDCGYKCGLNGVDNGAIRFTHVRIPRWHLLDRHARVERTGAYTTSLSRGERFQATLGALVGGRIGALSASIGVLKGACTIAVRYAASRVQFGPSGGAAVAAAAAAASADANGADEVHVPAVTLPIPDPANAKSDSRHAHSRTRLTQGVRGAS